MATSPTNVNRLFDGGAQFVLGADSYTDVEDLPSNKVAWAINCVNRGGKWVTRPGFNPVMRVPDGRAQGCTLFTPTAGIPTIVFAVSGLVYTSQFPFEEYNQLANIEFDAFVDHIVFKEAIQSSSGGAPITPRSVLIMQDGRSRPAFWDGSTDRHLLPGGTTQETVLGLWMEFVGGRLWVSRGTELFASDIFNPLSFTETQYIAGGGSLQAIDGQVITALKRTADNKNLLVYTLGNTSIVQAGITTRSAWSSTPGFVSLLFPGVGCVAGKSPVENGGELWWYSMEGVRRFTQVGSSIQTSKSRISSIEMQRSYNNLSPTISRACGFSFNSYVGFGVASGDVFNRHIWVIDQSGADLLTSQIPASWQGIWMGIRPVEWAFGSIQGVERCFCLSQDTCGVRIWEAFQQDQEDNGDRIYCSLEFNGVTFPSKDSSLAFKKFLFTEYHLTGVAGDVSLIGHYRGDYGCWKENLEANLCATDCMGEAPVCTFPQAAPIQQNRYIKTQESTHVCESQEGPFSEDIGTFFQSRLRWYGKAGVTKYRSQAFQWQEKSTGECAMSDITCKNVSCCDQEVDYVSHVQDGYNYPSSTNTPTCSL